MGKRIGDRIVIIGAGVLMALLVLERPSAQHRTRTADSASLPLASSVPAADSSPLSSRPDGKRLAPITVDYPQDGSLFPPEITAPTFLWRDSAESAASWLIVVSFADGSADIQVKSQGERMRIGEIDPRCVAETNKLPELTPQQAAAWTWTPDTATWEAIKEHSVESPATATITGFRDKNVDHPVSRGAVVIRTSKDPVGAPIFYRDVPLMPSELQKGVIKPLAPSAIPLIAWRLRNVGESRSRLLLEGLHTCANCHSFSRDGKTLGMDLDGPGNDKGLYILAPISSHMSIGNENIISWDPSQDRQVAQMRIGFMSQVSPDGQYVVTSIPGEGDSLKNSYYVANFRDYRFLQVFYPTRGILNWYSRATGRRQPLPGADDRRYVHTGVTWSPDGKYLVFARAEARDPYPEGVKMADRADDPEETPIQYDLYRIPFNDGKGGRPEAIAGASRNGMSNTFPKISPDGRWIVFVKCRNGQLMRPDSQLYIVPAEGGQARKMRCNTPLMNSWHSFSPNGRWLVFSSKSRSPYTQMFLTHLDEEGNDSPAILIENTTAANRAVNIPEFVNIPPDGLAKIDVPAAEFYRLFDRAYDLAEKGQDEQAITAWKEALELDPGDAKAHNNLGVVLLRRERLDEGITHFQQAVELRPEYADAHNNLGLAQLRTGRLDNAMAHLQKALEVNPGYAQVYETFISNFRALVDVSPAASRGGGSNGLNEAPDNPKKSAQERDKVDEQYRRSLDAVIAYLLGRGEPARARAGIQRTEWPESPNAGVIQQSNSNLSPDIYELSSERSEIEKLIADLNIPRLRKLAEQEKDTDDRIAAQRQILRIFLHTFRASRILFEQKKDAQALMCLEIASQAAPRNPYISYDLARAQALNRQEKKALKTLQTAVEKGFNHPEKLEGDRAFEGLRARADYQKALARMRASLSQTQPAP